MKILSYKIDNLIKSSEFKVEFDDEFEDFCKDLVIQSQNFKNAISSMVIQCDENQKAIELRAALAISDTIYSGQSLETYESLLSTTECFATIKPDGNFVLYHTLINGVTEIWSSNTSSSTAQKPFKLTLNNDGNLVLNDVIGKTVWETKTSNKGKAPYRLTMQSDGNLVLYDSNYKATWFTDARGKINFLFYLSI